MYSIDSQLIKSKILDEQILRNKVVIIGISSIIHIPRSYDGFIDILMT